MRYSIFLYGLIFWSVYLGAEPVRLIFDTDMGNDIDDAMALAMIHNLEKRGACRLLAVTTSKAHPKSASFIDALNTFYGKPDAPVGMVVDGVTPDEGKFLSLADATQADGSLVYPHDLRSGDEAMEAVSLLRETLAAQPEHSVTIVQVGFSTNLAALLDSTPDQYSPLAGVALVEEKVKTLVVMAGAFQTISGSNRWSEYNVNRDIDSARGLAENWPTPMIWSGYEIGIAAPYPWQSIVEDYEYIQRHPVKEGYLAFVSEQARDRPTWDLTAVLAAVYPDRGYFGFSPPGTVTVESDGATRFRPDHGGRHRFLTMDAVQAARVSEACVLLSSEPPKGF